MKRVLLAAMMAAFALSLAACSKEEPKPAPKTEMAPAAPAPAAPAAAPAAPAAPAAAPAPDMSKDAAKK
jgi:hypothetical protein